jgi:hypothetical protein
MTKRRIYMGVIMLAAVLAYSGSSQANEEFTLRSLMGTFGFSGSGTFAGAPAAVVGLSRFDGVGGCSCVRSAPLLVVSVLGPASFGCLPPVSWPGRLDGRPDE